MFELLKLDHIFKIFEHKIELYIKDLIQKAEGLREDAYAAFIDELLLLVRAFVRDSDLEAAV